MVKFVQGTVKSIMTLVSASGWMGTEMRGPENFVVSMPPKRTEPVFASRSFR